LPPLDKSGYTLDLAYLYADPLLHEVKVVDSAGRFLRKELGAFSQPLSTDLEFERIIDLLKKTGKRFSVMKEVASQENLMAVLARKPMMLHISCHGDCEDTGRQQRKSFFLAFEGTEEQLCLMERLNEEKLRDLLGCDEHHYNKSKLLIVFVSACHSEGIGQLFKRMGVPVVVAVNSHTTILDDVCRLFARHFYQHLAFGESPY
jgi:hypothetical protein